MAIALCLGLVLLYIQYLRCDCYPPLFHGIEDYELLSYRPWPQETVWAAESIPHSPPLELRLVALGRRFHLELIVDMTAQLLADVQGHWDTGEKEFRPLTEDHLNQHHVSGSDISVNGSHVIGYIRNGLFYGQVTYPQDGIFYIDKTSQRGLPNTNDSAHSVIYQSSHIYAMKNSYHNPVVLPEQQGTRPLLHRWRREFPRITWTQRICTVHAFADHTFFKEVGGENVGDTIDAMAQHIRVATSALLQADFDFDGQPDQLGLAMSQITIFTEESAKKSDYLLPESLADPHLLLRQAQHLNLKGVCLGVLFVARDLTGSNLGVSYEANPSLGGICSNAGPNYNVLIVTFNSNGRSLPPILTEVTLMHEVGHALGAAHDSEACHDRNDPDGFYIMYAKATPGYFRNNRLFSSCSRHEIGNVLQHRRDIRKCLKYVNTSYCGNAIVEPGEDCDCGGADGCDSVDKCCYPRAHPMGGCTLRRDLGFQCSPKKGPCCTDQCQFKPPATHCGLKHLCKSQSFCSGESPLCPPARPYQDLQRCANGQAVCVEGECIGSPCLLLKGRGWSQCECQAEDVSCHVCCQKDGLCVDTFSGDPDFVEVNISNLLHPANRPCHQYQGYCTGDGVCHGVDFSDSTEAVGKAFHHMFTGIKALLKFWYLVLFVSLIGPLAFYSWTLARLSHDDIHLRYQAFKTRVSHDFTESGPLLDDKSSGSCTERKTSKSTSLYAS